MVVPAPGDTASRAFADDLGKHTEEAAKVVMRRLLDAIADMHDRNVSHRDRKLENIVLRESGDLGTVTTVDFAARPGRQGALLPGAL